MSSWHRELGCLLMGLPRFFLYMCKAQAGEAESKAENTHGYLGPQQTSSGGDGTGGAIIWLQSQPRFYHKERLLFPLHLPCGSGKSPGLPQLRNTYHLPHVPVGESPTIREPRRQEDAAKIKCGAQSQLHVYLHQHDKCLARSP